LQIQTLASDIGGDQDAALVAFESFELAKPFGRRLSAVEPRDRVVRVRASRRTASNESRNSVNTTNRFVNTTGECGESADFALVLGRVLAAVVSVLEPGAFVAALQPDISPECLVVLRAHVVVVIEGEPGLSATQDGLPPAGASHVEAPPE
jgi:hypothetical protein